MTSFSFIKVPRSDNKYNSMSPVMETYLRQDESDFDPKKTLILILGKRSLPRNGTFLTEEQYLYLDTRGAAFPPENHYAILQRTPTGLVDASAFETEPHVRDDFQSPTQHGKKARQGSTPLVSRQSSSKVSDGDTPVMHFPSFSTSQNSRNLPSHPEGAYKSATSKQLQTPNRSTGKTGGTRDTSDNLRVMSTKTIAIPPPNDLTLTTSRVVISGLDYNMPLPELIQESVNILVHYMNLPYSPGEESTFEVRNPRLFVSENTYFSQAFTLDRAVQHHQFGNYCHDVKQTCSFPPTSFLSQGTAPMSVQLSRSYMVTFLPEHATLERLPHSLQVGIIAHIPPSPAMIDMIYHLLLQVISTHCEGKLILFPVLAQQTFLPSTVSASGATELSNSPIVARHYNITGPQFHIRLLDEDTDQSAATICAFIERVLRHPLTNIQGKLIPSSIPSAILLRSIKVTYAFDIQHLHAYPFLDKSFFANHVVSVISGFLQRIPIAHVRSLLIVSNPTPETLPFASSLQRGNLYIGKGGKFEAGPSVLTLLFPPTVDKRNPIQLAPGSAEARVNWKEGNPISTTLLYPGAAMLRQAHSRALDMCFGAGSYGARQLNSAYSTSTATNIANFQAPALLVSVPLNSLQAILQPQFADTLSAHPSSDLGMSAAHTLPTHSTSSVMALTSAASRLQATIVTSDQSGNIRPDQVTTAALNALFAQWRNDTRNQILSEVSLQITAATQATENRLSGMDDRLSVMDGKVTSLKEDTVAAVTLSQKVTSDQAAANLATVMAAIASLKVAKSNDA